MKYNDNFWHCNEYNKNKYLFGDDLIDNYCEMWLFAVSTMFNGLNDAVACNAICAFANLGVVVRVRVDNVRQSMANGWS